MASKPPSNRNRNRYAFTPTILDQDSHEKRRVIKQLPAVHQTETLQKFFGASADNLFDPGKGKSINGYVGQIPLWYEPDQDYYLAESNSDRDFYQLEASMVSKNSEGETTNLLFYTDLINQIRFQGGNVENHHRLFSQDFYSWCPPIDLDKILNYRQYVWLPTNDVAPISTFEDGNSDGWVLSDGTPAPIQESEGGFTRFIGRFAGTLTGEQIVSKTFTLNSSAMTDIEFDFLKIDSWDAIQVSPTSGGNERITVYLNDELVFEFTPVGFQNTGGNASIAGSFTAENFSGTYVITSPTSLETQLGFNTLFADRIYHIAISINNTSETLKIGFGSTTNQSITDESLGIDNFTISQSSSTAIQVYGPTVEYEANGSTTIFKLPGYETGGSIEVRDYYDLVMLKKSLIRATVDGNSREFTYIDGQDQIEFNDAPAIDAEVKISVYSDIENTALSLINADPLAYGGQKLSSNMRIRLINDISTDYQPNDVYIVEDVGSSIKLIKENKNISSTIDDSQPDYIVMARGATDGNEWSTGNRWFHVSTLLSTLDPDYISTLRATRPIIEFDRNLELFNYGTSRRLDIYSVSDSVINLQAYITNNPIDIEVGNVKFAVSGGEITITDLITNEISVGNPSARILVRNTENELVNDRVYVVTNSNGQINVILEADGLNPSGEPVFGEILKVKYGSYKNVNLHWNGAAWVPSQVKSSTNQPPLFTLYDLSGNSINDVGLYPSSDFAGSKLFGYKLDTTGTRINDQVLGFPLLHDNKGQILFENYLATENYTYLDGSRRAPITGFYFHKVVDVASDFESLSNDWFKAEYPSRQYMVDRFVADGKSQVFVISQEPIADIDDQPASLQVTIGRVSANKNFERIPLVEDIGFIRIGRRILISSVIEGDIVEVRTFNPANPPLDATGHYEIPFNLQANPDNAEVSDISKGDFYEQFSDIIRSQDGFIGAEYSNNNWRDTAKIKNRGKFITQQSASLLKTMLLASESQFDITSAIRFSESEYSRFKTKFQQKILEYSVKRRFNGSASFDTQINTALEELNRGKTKEFPFYLSSMGVNDAQNLPTFIPATPSFLGVYPLYIPEMVTGEVEELDLEGNPVTVEVFYIKGHDGSWTQARNFEVAQVVLALEERIYLSVPDNIRNKERPVFDWQIYYSDQYRSNDYSYQEYLNILQPSFERWSVSTGQDYRANTIYDQQDPWTWNWSSVPAVNGDILPGHWRGIYEKFFGTQRPDLSPWESLGFSAMPEWWTSRYGPAPYTSDNTLLWSDLESGFIFDGPRKGINKEWARPGVSEYIPVDEAGQLLHPGSVIELDPAGIRGCGIAQDTPLYKDRGKAWQWGDLGPVEQDWRRSSFYPFAVSIAGYLMKPAKFIEMGWNTKDLVLLFEETDNEQWLNLDTMGRPSHSELQVHGEVLEDFSLVKKIGIQQWVSDLMISKNTAIAENFADKVRGLGVQLAYKVGGYTDSSTLIVVSDAFGRVPSEDAAVNLYRSPSIREETYSGLAIEYMGSSNYRIFGYDSLKPFFKIIPGDPNGNKISIGESNKSVSIPGWRPNTFYTVNLTLKYSDKFYRCIKTHTSGAGFEPVFWIEVSRPLYADGARLVWNLETTVPANEQSINYGTVYKSPQSIADFISGYDRYLKSRGWVFDGVDGSDLYLKDWQQALRDFITWSQDDARVAGDFISLSPGSNQIKFVTDHGAIQPIEQIVNGLYAVVDQQGQPIASSLTRVVRSDGELVVSCDATTSGIYGIRLYVSEYEHAIVFNNTTIFNDTIYNPLLNIRQPRLRIQGFKTVAWKGRIDAPGFIITDNSLTPNFERAADDFRRFFDIEAIENKKLQDRARANFGYEEREYLNNLLLTPTNQFEFFQGMIQQKGSPTSMRRLLRSNFIRHNKGLKLFEEWAFRIGDFGGSEVTPSFDIKIKQSDFKHNPQLIKFTTSESPPAVQTGVINIVDIKDSSGKLIELDPNWEWRPDVTDINWPKKDFVLPVERKSLLPTAGYVKLDEVTWTAATYSEFEELYRENNLLGSEAKIKTGDRAWVYGIERPLLSDGNIDPLAWSTYKFHNTNYTIDRELDPSFTEQGVILLLGAGQSVKPNLSDAAIVATNPTIDSLYLATNQAMFPYVSNYRERIYIESLENEAESYGAFVPKLGGIRSLDIDVNTSSVFPIMDLVSDAKMWIRSIKVKVTKAYDVGSTLTVGTELLNKSDYFIQNYTPGERDLSNINSSSPEQVVVSTPPLLYIDQDANTADIELIRVGNITEFCNVTTVEWYYQRAQSNGTPLESYNLGGTLVFTRPSDASIDTDDYYTQNISVPITTENDQAFNIRLVTNPSGMNPITTVSNVQVQRPATSNLNFVDLTTVGEYYFRWLSASPPINNPYANYPSLCSDSIGKYLQGYISTAGIRGKATIEVEYFYTSGFELQTVGDDGELVPGNATVDETGGFIYTWIPTRYPNISARNLVTGVWNSGDIVEVDSGAVNGQWSVYQYNGNTWLEKRRQNRKISTELLESAAIYDSRENELKLVLQPYDPAKGFIPGSADRELYYKLTFDPAIYVNTGAAGKGKIWGQEEVGRLWWNLKTMRYLDYEIYDDITSLGTNYRWKNWGRVAPGITVDILQWTRSPVQPSEWETYVSSKNDIKVESYNNKPTGVVVDPVNASFVTATEWNDDIQSEETVYYFWVKNCTTPSLNEERKLSAQQVSNIIANPIGSDIPFFAVIENNQIVVGGIRQFLTEQDTVLKVKWNSDVDIINNHHKQWLILREEDERNTIEDSLWNKMRDSLVGWDTFSATSSIVANVSVGANSIVLEDGSDFSASGSFTCAGIQYFYNGKTGNTLLNIIPVSNGIIAGSTVIQTVSTAKSVPDPKLPKAQQLGSLVRPRQSWFPAQTIQNGQRPSRDARESFVECMNDIFSAAPFIDQWFDWQLVFNVGETLPTSDRYVTTALDLADLKLLLSPARNAVQPNECVLIESTVEAGGFWTLWQMLQTGSDTSTRRFVLIDFQKWRMQEGEMWNPVNWYADGWSAANFPNYRFPTYADRDAAGNLDFTLLKGTLVQVDIQSPTDPRWSWDVYTSTTKYQVAKQNGTIALTDVFYDDSKINFGNAEIYGPNGLLDPYRQDLSGNTIGLITPERISELGYFVENRDGSRELEFMINSLKENLLDTLQKNRIFFTMVKSAFRQNKVVDWAFKTSFLYLGGYSEELRQSPVAFKDQIDNVISYLEEVKPYHVKIREYVRRLSFGPDIAKLMMTDFDKPVYLDNGNYRILDINNLNDVAIMQANRPWKDWINNYLNDNYDIADWDSAWNPIRRMNVELLFDRVSCGTVKGWDTAPWDPPYIVYSQNDTTTESLSSLSAQYRTGNNDVYDTTVETIAERNLLVRNGLITPAMMGSIVTVLFDKSRYMWTGNIWIEFEAQGWDQDIRSGMASRIEEAYNPKPGMLRKDAPNLISGCDFDGTIITDLFQNGGWDQFEWDSTGLSSEYQQYTGVDIDRIDGNAPEVQSEADINLDGNYFAQPKVNGNRPEEMIKINGRDSGFLTVTQRSDADTLAAIPAFNVLRQASGLWPLPQAVTPGHIDVGAYKFRLWKNLNGDWEKIKLEDSNTTFVNWDQTAHELTIATADGVFPFHDPKNPSEEFLDKVKLTKAYRSITSHPATTVGDTRVFEIRDVDNSGVLKEIPFGLMGNNVKVVIENANNPIERALGTLTNNLGNEAMNWDGTITVIFEASQLVGSLSASNAWNILPLEAYDQPGVIWIEGLSLIPEKPNVTTYYNAATDSNEETLVTIPATNVPSLSRFRYNTVTQDGTNFILSGVFLSGNSLSNLTITTSDSNGELVETVTLTSTSQLYDGSALKLIA